MQKILPPFGEYQDFRLSIGDLPDNDVYIFMGKHANVKCSDFQFQRMGTMYLPPDKPPRYYDWPVKNCDILIFDMDDSSQEYVEEFVSCLFNAGARIVRYVSSQDLLTIYKKDF